MAKTIYKHVSILDPHVDVDEIFEAKAIVQQLGIDHPEWKGLQWSTRLTISTENPSEFCITVVDPDAKGPENYVWVGIGIIVAMFMLYYFNGG